MNELAKLRRQGAIGLVALCWLCVLVLATCAFFTASGPMPVVAGGMLALVPTIQLMRGDISLQSRMALGIALPLYPAILLWQWSGHGWMIDIHMAFFAAIAMLTILADWRPVLLSAAITAVHHLATNFVAPSLVFSDGPDFGRVVLHALIVIAETSVLVFIARSVEMLVIAQATEHAERERVQAVAEAERARTAAEQKAVIEQIGNGLSSLAKGDLTLRLNDRFPGGYEEMRAYFNSAASDLDRIVRDVTQSAGQIELGSHDIRTATDDLALRTEQQAATLEDIATTLQQLHGTVKSNAASAGELQETVAQARNDACKGSNVVENAVLAMGEIERSSNEISQIITLIDGIAFQTNLLALNAGVEAARAGEAGKGFAVVASEVRALAQRSADAANRIKTLISTSSDQVSEGARLVEQSGQALATIVAGISQIDVAIERIATVSQAQAGEIGHINERVTRLDSATQQNAAMVEESTAAARNLSDEAATLAQVVNHFRVSDASKVSVTHSFSGSVRQAA